MLRGLVTDEVRPQEPLAPAPLVVFAGRLIPEKNALAVVSAVALAGEHVPGLHGVIFGDGPQREAVLARIAALTQPALVSAPGFVDSEVVHDAIARACCLLLPSRREGYALVVVEASAVGTPAILVRGPDNAAVELLEDGVNGVIAASAEPADLAAAIVAVVAGGPALRASTREWFARNAQELSIERSLRLVLAGYEPATARA